MTRFDPSKFTTGKAKPLPVFLLLDVSGSMNEVLGDSFVPTGQTVVEDGQTWEIVRGGHSRIQVLNQAVAEMIASLAKEEQLDHEFLVTVITFGDAVQIHLPGTRASSVQWKPLEAAGETPLGEALALAKRLVEDRETTPSRAYRPMVVLVSDGKPTDKWQAALDSFVSEGRSSKCDRAAVAIGAGADEDMLRRFIAGMPNPLFHADDAKQINEVFKRVTMSITVRSRSSDPNQVQGLARVAVGPVPAVEPAPSARKPPASDDGDGYW